MIDRPVPEAQQPALSVHGVRVTFGDQPILRGIDLVVAPGARVALLGPNGAGKTTLLRVLAGLLRPSAGAVRIGGHSFGSDANAARRSIGMVGHQSLLYPELTVWENLLFYARLYRVGDPAARAQQMLHLVELDARRADRVAALSRGTAQRLALARALLHDPPILLLDEPDAGLDARAFAMLSGLLAETSGQRRTVLLTTHDLDHALQLCSEVVILHGGRIVDRLGAADLDLPMLRERYAALTAPVPGRPLAPAGRGA